jgi:AraC-like DNA-binding protein
VFKAILLAGSLQGLLLAALLAGRPANRLANRLLALLMVVVAAQTALVAFDERDFFMHYPHLSRVGWVLPALFGPLFYLFVDKLVTERPRLRRADAVHLLPVILFTICLLPYFSQSAEAKRAWLDDYARSLEADFGWMNQVANILHLGYLGLSFVRLKQYRRRLLNERSEIERLRLRWLGQFLLFLLIILAVSIPVFYARKWHFAPLAGLYGWHYLLVVACVYWIGYRELSQATLFSPAPDVPASGPAAVPDVPAAKYRKTALSDDRAAAFRDELLQFMQTQRPYLQNDLTLTELSARLGWPRHQLSQIINDQLGVNFYDFINGYRVEAAQSLLLDPGAVHLTVLAVAEEAGFNSKATFNSVFKKITGLTPSEFVRRSKEPEFGN